MEAIRILDALLEPAMIVRSDGKIAAVNAAWLQAPVMQAARELGEGELPNRGRDGYEGVQAGQLFRGREDVLNGLTRVMQGEQEAYTQSAFFGSGKNRQHYDIRITPIFDHEGGAPASSTSSATEMEKQSAAKVIWGVLIVFVNVTSHKQREAELIRMAYYDFLTGMYNRRKLRLVLEETIAHASQKGNRFAVLLLDLDNFKWINDSYGHDVGDLALKEFARRLLECRRENVVVGRLSGDEFFVVMQEVDDEKQVFQFIEQVEKALIDPLHIPETGTYIQINLSAGYAIYPENGKTVKELFKHADVSLYHEKPKFLH